MEKLHWGIVPFWAKDTVIGSRMINARSETVATKPTFKTALKWRRCLMQVRDGYSIKKDLVGTWHSLPYVAKYLKRNLIRSTTTYRGGRIGSSVKITSGKRFYHRNVVNWDIWRDPKVITLAKKLWLHQHSDWNLPFLPLQITFFWQICNKRENLSGRRYHW